MKKILLIGGGPVGLTFANITSKHFAIQVIIPNQPLKFKKLISERFGFGHIVTIQKLSA